MKFAKAGIFQLLAIFFVLLVSLPTMQAQTNSGAVRGEVKDTQGANIGKHARGASNLRRPPAHSAPGVSPRGSQMLEGAPQPDRRSHAQPE